MFYKGDFTVIRYFTFKIGFEFFMVMFALEVCGIFITEGAVLNEIDCYYVPK